MEIYTSQNTELKCKIKSGIIIRIDFPNTSDFYNLEILNEGDKYFDTGIIDTSKIFSIYTNIELPKIKTDYKLCIHSKYNPIKIILTYIVRKVEKRKINDDDDADDEEEDSSIDANIALKFKNLKIKSYGCKYHDNDKNICAVYQCCGD